MARPRNPWDVSLSDTEREALADWLHREIENALSVRSAKEAEVAYWHTLYEQGRTRTGAAAPWPDAADLTSPIATEKVDALRSRIVKTIFVEPIWTVEGWGDAGGKAPFIEEFHQWQAETSGFQATFTKAVHLSLIEPRGTIEVYEDTLRRPVRRTIKAAPQVGPDGAVIISEDMQPVLQTKPDGSYVEVVDDPQMPEEQRPPAVEVVIDDYELVCNGPRERVIPYRDFLMLPGHATEKTEIWGYAKRFWRRVAQLRERAEIGQYDRAAVENLGTNDQRASETTLAGEAVGVPSQEDDLAEKELWEITFLWAPKGTGVQRWFVATLHLETDTLLRLQYDTIGRPRYFQLVPFPRPHSLDGYSFVGHKLITTIEENTAWRNMLADRASLQLQSPIKRLTSALWNPEDQPLGPKSVIDVRDMNEVQPFQMPDYTAPARERIIDTERQAEKLGGMTDISSGSRPNEDRTLGETRMVTAFSEVRIEEVVRNIQETLEEIAQVRHLMWKRAIADRPDGVELPERVLQGLETRAVDVSNYLPNGRITADLFEGAFRFKPRGSVEQTDRQSQRANFSELFKALSAMAMVNPMFRFVLQQPQVARAFLEELIRLYSISDKQAFLGAQTWQNALKQMEIEQMQQATAALQAMQGAQGGGAPTGRPPMPKLPSRPMPASGGAAPQPPGVM